MKLVIPCAVLGIAVMVTVFGCGKITIFNAKKQNAIGNLEQEQHELEEKRRERVEEDRPETNSDNIDHNGNRNQDDTTEVNGHVDHTKDHDHAKEQEQRAREEGQDDHSKLNGKKKIPRPKLPPITQPARASLEATDEDGKIVDTCTAYFIPMNAKDANSENYKSQLLVTEAHCIVTSNPPFVDTIEEAQKHRVREVTSLHVRWPTGAILKNNPIYLMEQHNYYRALGNQHNPDGRRDGIYQNDIALALFTHPIMVHVPKRGKPRWVNYYEENDHWFKGRSSDFIGYSGFIPHK